MQANRKQYELSDYAFELIYHKARQLVGTAGFTWDDVEDIEQDLTLDLLERLAKFDPAKATYNTFVARIVERKISKLIRHRMQEMRDYRREDGSLNDPIDNGRGETSERLQTISQDEHDARTGRHTRPAAERMDLQIDVRQALAELPQELRRAGELLMTMPVAQAARAMGIPRSTFYDAYLAKLRRAFEDRGLRDYLETSSRRFAHSPGK